MIEPSELPDKEKEIVYNATKTASAFHNDNSFVRLLMGPVGCGKSVANLIEIFVKASQQEKGSDGVRRTRWAVIRNTYPELRDTTIKTFQEWFPERVYGSIKMNSPPTINIRVADIDCEIIFLALDSPTDIKKLMSLELTGVYINELQFIPKIIFDTCLQRIDRYPAKISGAKITWTGVIADTNPPDNEHWIYKLFEEARPENYRIFKYEPALLKVKTIEEGVPHAISTDGTIYITNPSADYVRCQNNKNYWFKLVAGYTDEQIKVSLNGEYGIFIDGRPVHPEYNDTLHFSAKNFIYNPQVELGLGWDFGLTPAVAICQLTPEGQLIILDELFNDKGNLREFAESEVKPHLDKKYPGWEKNYISVHDPAGQTGSQTDGNSCQKILKDIGIESEPAADNNNPTARRDGLKQFLGRLKGGYPAFILTMGCPRLRKALMGGYHYSRKKGADGLFYDKPNKNIYSHIAEALEYIAMHYAKPIDRTTEKEMEETVMRYWHYSYQDSGSSMI